MLRTKKDRQLFPLPSSRPSPRDLVEFTEAENPLELHYILQLGAVTTFLPYGPRARERSTGDLSP